MAAFFTVLTIVGAQISIPIGQVPITLQTLMVFLSGYILDPSTAFLSQLSYIILGALGAPVFSNLSGGIVHIIGPTGGYLIAFPLAAWSISIIKKKENFVVNIFAGTIGLGIIYFLGWIILACYLRSLAKAFVLGVVPFIPIDLFKLVVALVVYEKTFKILPEEG